MGVHFGRHISAPLRISAPLQRDKSSRQRHGQQLTTLSGHAGRTLDESKAQLTKNIAGSYKEEQEGKISPILPVRAPMVYPKNEPEWCEKNGVEDDWYRTQQLTPRRARAQRRERVFEIFFPLKKRRLFIGSAV